MDMDRKAIELSKYQHIFLLIKLIQLAAGPAHSGQPFYHCLAKKGAASLLYITFSSSRPPSYDQFLKMTLYNHSDHCVNGRADHCVDPVPVLFQGAYAHERVMFILYIIAGIVVIVWFCSAL